MEEYCFDSSFILLYCLDLVRQYSNTRILYSCFRGKMKWFFEWYCHLELLIHRVNYPIMSSNVQNWLKVTNKCRCRLLLKSYQKHIYTFTKKLVMRALWNNKPRNNGNNRLHYLSIIYKHNKLHYLLYLTIQCCQEKAVGYNHYY